MSNHRAELDMDADGGTIATGPTDSPAANFEHVFEKFGLSPDAYEIVDGSVRCSAWEVGQETKYSYRARFRPVIRAEDVVSPRTYRYWRESLQDGRANRTRETGQGERGYVITLGDQQWGKRGTAEAVENFQRGLIGHLEEIDRRGDIEEITLAFLGDEIENVAGHYAGQSHTVELNLTRQLELDFEQRCWAVREAASMGVPLQVVSVLSNHGEAARLGTNKNQTSASDNHSTSVARMIKAVFTEAGRTDISWAIANSEPDILINVAGIGCSFAHGHIAKGRGQTAEQRQRNAIDRQLLGRPEELRNTRLWFTAHYHHYAQQEFGDRTLFMCPALEAEKSSSYFFEQYGIYNLPGSLGVAVGTGFGRRGYASALVK